jgi:hypothetical protein
LRHLVVLSRLSRLSGVAIAIALAFVNSACSTTTTAPSGTKSSVSQPTATKAAGTDGDTGSNAAAALPGLGSGCDQNTHPQIVPDNSQTAALPGGATTKEGLLAGMKAHRGVAGFDFPWAPAIETPIPTVVGVVCPKTGAVYQYGDPVAWGHVRIINRDPKGNGVIPRGNGMYSHLASEALASPARILLQIGIPTAKQYCLDMGFYTGIIFANGDMIEPPPIDPSKVEKPPLP